MLRFFLAFVVLQLGLFGINMLSVVQQHVVLPWTSLLARGCVALVTLFDDSAAATGKVLWNMTTGFAVSIEPGCNGVEACIVLFAGVMAFPSSWRYKLVGLATGFVAVQLLNVVRIISLFYLGQWNMEVFNFAHEYLWQALIMLDVLVVWLLWVRAVARAEQAHESDAPPDEPPAPPALPTPASVVRSDTKAGLITTSLDLSPPVGPAS